MSALPYVVSNPATHDAGLTYKSDILPTASPPVSPSSASRGRLGHKRTLSRSEDSGDDGDEGSEARKKPPGIKRACNECRQQKVRSDVDTEV